jgi:2-amino-4-hydroxy-6-hydroxymethyldihydropteridine diphosphokinase
MSGRVRRVVFGLGSNLGDRVEFVRAAVARLRALPGTQGAVRSGMYETAPVGGPPQGDYINAALLLNTDRPATWLLTMALQVEQEHGRVRQQRNGPRTLDIDLLWIDGEMVTDSALTVPHPRLVQRAFALVPLLEVAPDAREPRSGRLLSDWLSRLDCRGVRAFSPAFFYPPVRGVGVPLDTQAWKC